MHGTNANTLLISYMTRKQVLNYEKLNRSLAVDGKYLMTNTVRDLMERDRTLQNVPTDNQKAIVQDMTARCLVVAQALCCTLEEAYKEINKVD